MAKQYPNSPQNIKRSDGERTVEKFSDSVKKGTPAKYGAAGPSVRSDLTNPKFGRGAVGAPDTERRTPVQHAKGGATKMFADQPAVTKTRARTGPEEVSNRPINNINRKVGQPAKLGGPKLRYVGAGAAPQVPGRVGGSVGIDADKSLKGK
jgi:hypothetical protein